MSNQLILRINTSSFPTPYQDTTQGSVLSFGQLDNNFIHLKGLAIYSAITDTDNIILKQLNGDNLTIPYSSMSGLSAYISGGTGTTVDQDNKIVRKYMILHQVDGSINAVVNLINTFSPIMIGEKEIPIYYIYHLSPTGVYIYKYIMCELGKGTYGAGGIQLTVNDIELIYVSQVSVIDVGNLENTEIINYGDIEDMTIDEWLNSQSPAIDIQSLDIGFTLFQGTINGITTDYLWIGTSGTYGLGEDQSSMDDFQLVDDESTNGLQNLRSVLTVGNYVRLSSYANLVKLIISNSLIPFQPYLIPDVDMELYGGTEIIIQAISGSVLSQNAIGKFYTPKYDQTILGLGIWDSTKTYDIGDTVHWGGKSWTNANGLVGASIDIYNLDDEWVVIPFNESDYNVNYDNIKYDANVDVIFERNEGNSNIVSSSVDDMKYWNDLASYNPIKAFQWGNLSSNEAALGEKRGLSNQKIINSYNENINFKGLYQQNILMTNLSEQSSLNFSEFAYQDDIVLVKSRQNLLSFLGESAQISINLINSSQGDLIFLDSYQTYLDLKYSYQQTLYFTNCGQESLSFINGGQENITATGISQSYCSFNNYFRSTPITISESELNFYGAFPNDNTTTKVLGFKDNKLVQLDKPNSFVDAPSNGSLYGRKDQAWSLVPIVAAPTGLEKLTEASQTGWRLIGQNPAQYGNIGDSAVDLSISDGNATRGATGPFSFAGGYGTTANGYASTAFGRQSIAAGVDSFVEGAYCNANGAISHAEGYSTTANGQYSHAEGYSTYANGQSSHANGFFNYSETYCETVIGVYSDRISGSPTTFVTTEPIFRVGIGTDGVSRKDAFRLYKNGAMYFVPNILSGITNAVNGFIAYDDSSKRLNIHNGSAWREVAHVSDIPVVKGGIITFTGDGITNSLVFAHGIGSIPTSHTMSRNEDTNNYLFQSVADTTNITVTFTSSIPTGGHIIKLNWMAFK